MQLPSSNEVIIQLIQINRYYDISEEDDYLFFSGDTWENTGIKLTLCFTFINKSDFAMIKILIN
jgi:hypothetical protein